MFSTKMLLLGAQLIRHDEAIPLQLSALILFVTILLSQIKIKNLIRHLPDGKCS